MNTISHVNAEAESKADQAVMAQFNAARDKLTALRADLAREETEVDANTARYEEAARLRAAGKDADPAAVLADTDRRRHTIAGLKALAAEKELEVESLQGPNRIATCRERERLNAARIAGLNAELASAESTANDAQAKLDRAQQEVRRLRLEISELQNHQSQVVREYHRAVAAA